MTAFDLFFEALLVLHPLYLVIGLQIAVKTKAKVMCAFSWRLLIVIPLALRISGIPTFYASTDETAVTSYGMSEVWIYTQIALTISIITPTIPMLQPFMRATATTFGMVTGDATNSYGDSKGGYRSGKSRSRSGRVSQQLSSGSGLKRFAGGSRGVQSDAHEALEQEEQYHYSASVVPAGRHRRSSNTGSDISQRPIIRREVQYDVSYMDEDGR